MATSKLNVIGDNGLGEPEQDANSALTELDKGLRSGNVGEQCEAIVRFPRLFEKYPFPILINSSFLKLADVFRVGSNFMRVWVLRVCQQSERHLDKILNVDEFVKRIFSVMHSNDPVARALALHVLGSVASIIPEREQVHHSIRNSLDSHDTVEVLAAVCSAAKFATHSRTFAVSMCNKIAGMIQGLDTPAELKLKLIPVLQHMHYTTSTAAMVRELGGELLQSYPAKDFILTSHDTLTKLATEALVDIPHQVDLLLSCLNGELRIEVKLHILRELKILAREGATHWPAGTVAMLIARAQDGASHSSSILASCLDVLSVLTKSASVCHEQMHSDSALMNLCTESCYSADPKIVCKAISIMTSISCYCVEAELPPLTTGNTLEMSLESFLLLLVSDGKARYRRELRQTLKCVLQLCNASPVRCQYFVQLIAEQMHNRMDRKDPTTYLLMETLAAIASINPGRPPILLPLLPELLSCLNSMPSDAKQGSLVCLLVLQICQGYSLNPEVCSTLFKYLQRCPVWDCYKLARTAMRYGQHMIAVPAVNRLTDSVSSEQFHFWILCLKEISLAECALLGESPVSAENHEVHLSPDTSSHQAGELLLRLTLANTHYAKAIAAMKAASSLHNSLQFPTEYIRLRADTLQCLAQLVQASLSLMHPAPAIAMNQAQMSGDELLRHGRTTTQLRKVSQEFRTVAENHAKLAQSAFDADPKTLTNIKILKNMCLLMSRSIDSIAITNYQERNMIDFESVKDCPEMHQIIDSCNHASNISEVISMNRALKPISYQHIVSLLQQVKLLAGSPLCLPRYFFQVRQCTTVKLSISPQSRLVGEISIQPHTQMVLRVEGVCQHQGKPGLYRSITSVKLALTSTLQSPSRSGEQVKDPSPTNITLVAHPHHDFFSAQFLLSFSCGGQYQICITASVIDAEGQLWRTGPKTFLVVKVYDDQQQTSNQAMAKVFGANQDGARVPASLPRF